MSRPLRWLGNLLLVGIGLLVALVLTEIAVRVISPQPTAITHQDRYGLAMHWPGLTRYLPLYGHNVSFNSGGMRDREHRFEKPAGVFRILVLGDSFMEALQVPFEASFPSLLEHDLDAKGARVEVINASVSGWGTDDELRYLERYGVDWKPDLVLVAVTLHNDISDNLRQEWHRLRNDSLVEVPKTPFSSFEWAKIRLKGFVATRLQLYQLWRRVRHGGEMRQIARNLDAHMVSLFRDPAPETIGRGIQLTDSLFSRLQQVASEAGARVAIMLLPLRVQLSDSSFAALSRNAGVPNGSMVLDRPQQDLRRIADRLKIPLIDLLPAFRQWTADSSAALFLERDGHWNAMGHRVAARTAGEAVVHLIEVR
jgi:lysophospholipase L1-like esterase